MICCYERLIAWFSWYSYLIIVFNIRAKAMIIFWILISFVCWNFLLMIWSGLIILKAYFLFWLKSKFLFHFVIFMLKLWVLSLKLTVRSLMNWIIFIFLSMLGWLPSMLNAVSIKPFIYIFECVILNFINNFLIFFVLSCIMMVWMLIKAVMMPSHLFLKTVSSYWWTIFYNLLGFFTNCWFFLHFTINFIISIFFLLF
jgi:hypothetical protein